MVKPGKLHWLAHDISNRGVTAWLLSAVLFAFYIVLYYTEVFTRAAGAIGLGSKWTLYGLLYSIAVVTGGVYVIRKYKHNRYQIVRTSVVMFVQVVFAFAIPNILKFFHQPEYYFSYLWPLKMDYLTPGIIFQLPLPFILYSFLGSLLMVPLLGVFFGKRWYCSWVCGCGGLANTAGEPFRHLTSKSSAAWKFEKVAIHSVLAICVALTALLFVSWGAGAKHPALTQFTYRFQSLYGLVVVAMLSGIIGVGLYPLGGTRVWCRNFCPMAAGAEVRAIPHLRQGEHVHLLRTLQQILRNGNRREVLRAKQHQLYSGVLRGMRALRRSLPARRAAPGKRHAAGPAGISSDILWGRMTSCAAVANRRCHTRSHGPKP